MQPIRIMHVVESLGVGGGVETGIANLIERMDPKRFEHILCAVFRMGPWSDRFQVVQVIPLEQKEKKMSTQVGPLARAIRRVNPHIVHSRNWGSLEAVLAGRWVRSCRLIHSEHGVETDPTTEIRRRLWFRRVAFELADRVFSVSYQLRDALATSTGFSVRKIGVIHNGVETARFARNSSVRSRLRAELGLSETEFCIGCVGRLNRIKDYPTILRAVAQFDRSCPSWRLLILGSGTDRGDLEEFVKSTPALRQRVHFLGASDHVPEFLNAIDVYVLPSIREGISNSLLEAMATSLPVIATDAGGNSEPVVDGESGLLFPVGDFEKLAELLVRLYREPETRDRLGTQALQRVTREFSLNSMISKYDRMYQELTGETAG
jgi:sugar transferase (PEP-CTERM/EpsH1 system associated)